MATYDATRGVFYRGTGDTSMPNKENAASYVTNYTRLGMRRAFGDD